MFYCSWDIFSGGKLLDHIKIQFEKFLEDYKEFSIKAISDNCPANSEYYFFTSSPQISVVYFILESNDA